MTAETPGSNAYDPKANRTAAIVGMALEPWEEGEGRIKIICAPELPLGVEQSLRLRHPLQLHK